MSINLRSQFRIALMGASFLLIAACGNKGPLVMPQKPVEVETQTEPAVVPEGETPPAQNEPADEMQPIDGVQQPIGDDVESDDDTP